MHSGKKVLALAGLLLTAAMTAGAAAHSSLPFIEDDYSKALKEAKLKKLPLFIEAWAPW